MYLNINAIFLTFEVLKESPKYIDSKLEHPENISDISVISEVSNYDKLIEIIDA